MNIRIFITGGTFDKEYNEITGQLYFKDTHLQEMLRLGRSRLDVQIRTLMMIDSLDMTDDDRLIIAKQCNMAEEDKIIITHGTDTMAETAKALEYAKQLYETAYGYLMQRDYGAAQGAFEDFLSRYPQDSLAGNAQYWLGEAHFVRGEYKAAASSFLKGYQNYAGNARAADSLLKLAMSLDRLGQKDAACSSFGELSTRFPNAPENVKMRAKSERQRIGCT